MNTLEVLTQARELISDPARWTRGYMARNKSGDAVSEKSPGAVCWCSIGAMMAVAGSFPNEIYLAWDVLEQLTGVGLLAYFNDNHTHEQVMEMFDAAIILAGEKL